METEKLDPVVMERMKKEWDEYFESIVPTLESSFTEVQWIVDCLIGEQIVQGEAGSALERARYIEALHLRVIAAKYGIKELLN